MKQLLALFLSASLFAAEVEDCSNLKIETPSMQDREHKKLRLDNGLEAILISDPQTPSSGAALAVSVGTWDDPQLRPGMAHFVEHLLFLGTKKYPQEEGYTRYLDEHGGTRNAFTMSDRTCYMFSVNNDGFSQALDRFGHFFIEPLFSESGIARECNAIHQEYCSYKPLDNWRTLYIKKELANPDHPFHAFCIGSLESLDKIPHSEVRSWYEEHYSSDRMHLVVISDKPMDQLQSEVEAIFSQVKRKDSIQDFVTASLFTEEAKGTLAAIYPVQEVQQLEIAWEIPRSFGQDMQHQVPKLVAHVLGHEGEGSLLSTLKKEELAEALGVGSHHAGQNQTFMTLSVGLTNQGIKQYEKVIERVYGALASLRESGISPYIFDEVVQLNEIDYRFQSRTDVFSFVSQWATGMVDEPLESFPRKSLIPSQYSEEQISAFLAELKPESGLYCLIAPQKSNPFKADREERWLGASYSLRRIPQAKIEQWQAVTASENVHLPKPNPFIPSHFDCHKEPTVATVIPQPKSFVSNDRMEIFHCFDDRFCVPEVSWSFSFASPLVREGDAKSAVLADLFCHAVCEKLNPIAYEAKLAGLDCSINTTRKGITLTISGYADKASTFLATILETMKDSTPSKEQFALYKQLAKRDYSNRSNVSTLKLGMERVKNVLYAKHTTDSEKLRVAKQMRYKDLTKFCDSIWERCFVQATLYGSQNDQQCKEVATLLEGHFGNQAYPLSEHPLVEVATLPNASLIVEQAALPSNALILTMDCGDFSFEARAAQEILSKGLEEPFFSELRTKQQTAYLVTSWAQEIERHLFTFFAIQSSSHEARDLLARFDLFLESSLQHLQSQTIPRERFEAIRAALIDRLEKPAENLSKMGGILHLFATEYDADFAWLEKRKEALSDLSYEQFIAYAHAFLGKENRQRLAIMVDGELPENQRFRYTPVQTFEKFRKRINYRSR